MYVISPSVIATSRAATFLLAVACCLQPATSPDAFFECQSGAAETRFAGLRCVSSEEGKSYDQSTLKNAKPPICFRYNKLTQFEFITSIFPRIMPIQQL